MSGKHLCKATPGSQKSQALFPPSRVYHENNGVLNTTNAAVYLPPESGSFKICASGDLVTVTRAGKLDCFYHNSEESRF